ncbi:M48 family metallopeptidase [Amycolatopsis sp. cg5]|uniref:M48 family metallopeptidase n=1 Tax=Amycolatopsis sp. cg5 TaxID=3238802 RepID=UPI00352477E0
MKFSVRAATAVALLAGFPALVLALVGGLVAFEVFAFRHSIFVAIKLGIITVPATYALLKGLLSVVKRTGDEVEGVLLTEAAQPELWALVRRLAVIAGTRPPDEIYLTGEVNAAVAEQTRWLGLRVLKRRMFIGAPLLAGLREDQLASVLTHELAHYSNNDTRLASVTYGGKRAVVGVLSTLDHSDWFQKLIGKLFTLYAKLYFRVSSAVCRRQELAADRLSARAAGNEAATSALRESYAIDAAWDLFMARYAVVGWKAGYLPSEVFDGFAELRDSVDDQLEKIRRNPPDEAGPYDSHPPVTVRVAAIDALPDEPIVVFGRGPATALLRNSAAVLDDALLASLVPEAREKRRVDWPTLVNLSCRADAIPEALSTLDAAGRAMRRVNTFRTLLDALDAGLITELVVTDLKPDPGAGPRAQREFAKLAVRDGLSSVVQIALADVGVARWDLSWSSPGELVVDEPYASEFGEALDMAIDGNTVELRRLLASAKVDLDTRPLPERSQPWSSR